MMRRNTRRACRGLLQQLADETRRQPRPPLDWDRVDRRIQAHLDHNDSAPSPINRFRNSRPGPRRSIMVLVPVGAVLGVLLWYGGGRVSGVVTEHEMGQSPDRPPGLVDGASLQAGETIAAGAEALTVEHGGVVRYRLDSHSRARLLAKGRWLTVGLERGSVLAAVAPGARSESFAVEVGQARFAVHGTRFRVTHTGQGATLSVLDGQVAVGRASDRGHMGASVLSAPDSAHFDLRGERLTEPAESSALGASKTPDSHLSTRRRVEPGRRTRHPQGESSVETPLVIERTTSRPPSYESQVDEQMTRAEAHIQSCFVRHTHAGRGIRVAAKTVLTLRVGASGQVLEIRLDPPLAAPVQQCTAQRLRRLRFPPSQHETLRERSISVLR